METQPRRFKLSAPAIEWIVVAAVITTAIALAILGVWIFRAETGSTETSLPRLILSDRATLGFARLLTAAATLYALASIIVLVMRGRWLRSISTTGIEAEVSRSDRETEFVKEDLARARAELNDLKRLMSGWPDG